MDDGFEEEVTVFSWPIELVLCYNLTNAYDQDSAEIPAWPHLLLQV